MTSAVRQPGDASMASDTPPAGAARSGEIVLRFLAAPMDVTYGGTVHGGRLLEWIDKAGYACAVGWSGRYCVTAYVGDVRFSRPVITGEIVEVTAQLVNTGRSSMNILVTVRAADPRTGLFSESTKCLTVFVAVDDQGRSVAVPTWAPATAEDERLQDAALSRVPIRADIEAVMREQTYSDAGTAPESVLRFLAAPTDVNWGGKVHGGTVMRWIDECAYVCAVGWSPATAVASYAGGVRFYRPLQIGSMVETRARLLHTSDTSMHISVHVSSGDLRAASLDLTTHCLIVFTALDDAGLPTFVPRWEPSTAEDHALDAHARELIELRTRSHPF